MTNAVFIVPGKNQPEHLFKVLLAAVEGAGKVSCPFPVICRTLVSCPWSSVVPCTTVHSVLQVQRLKNGHRNT